MYICKNVYSGLLNICFAVESPGEPGSCAGSDECCYFFLICRTSALDSLALCAIHQFSIVPQASFEYLCYGSTVIINIYSLSAGIDYRRQITPDSDV